jgi:hypothetical protein
MRDSASHPLPVAMFAPPHFPNMLLSWLLSIDRPEACHGLPSDTAHAMKGNRKSMNSCTHTRDIKPRVAGPGSSKMPTVEAARR